MWCLATDHGVMQWQKEDSNLGTPVPPCCLLLGSLHALQGDAHP